VLTSLLWRTLARDVALLRSYRDLVYHDATFRFGHTEAMGIYVEPPEASRDRIILRPWYINSMYGGSTLVGDCSIGWGDGRLGGVLPARLE